MLSELQYDHYFYAWGSIALIFSLYVSKKLYRFVRFVKKVNRLPGPQTIPLLGNLKETGYGNGPLKLNIDPSTVFHDIRQGLCTLYAKEKIFRVWVGGQSVIFVFGAETIEPILSSNISINKGFFYKIMDAWLGKGLLLSENEEWRSRRKLLTPTFHFRILQDFLPVMNYHSELLTKIIRNSSAKKPWVDIVPLLTYCTLDIISETAMGVRLNCQLNTESEYAKAIHGLTSTIAHRGRRPWLWFNFIFNLTAGGRIFKKSLRVINALTMKVIDEKKNAFDHNEKGSYTSESNGNEIPKKKLAFLDLLLEKQLSEKELMDEVNTFMFGGHDTTATTLTWVLYLLGLHQDIQEKVYNEMISVIGDTVSSVTLDHIRDLKYLDLVLKECQRLYTAIPGISRVIEEDLKVGDKVIPNGSTVFLFTYMLHRDPTVFPEPEKFDPERFSTEISSGRSPYAFLPFSAGPRNCIGQKYALMEEKVVLSHLLINFKITSLDPRDKVLVAPDLVLRPMAGVRLKFQSRSSEI